MYNFSTSHIFCQSDAIGASATTANKCIETGDAEEEYDQLPPVPHVSTDHWASKTKMNTIYKMGNSKNTRSMRQGK